MWTSQQYIIALSWYRERTTTKNWHGEQKGGGKGWENERERKKMEGKGKEIWKVKVRG